MRGATIVLTLALLAAGGAGLVAYPARGDATLQEPSAQAAPTVHRVTATPIAPREIPGRGPADRELVIDGSGFFGTSVGPFVRLNGRDAVAVVMDAAEPGRRLVAYAPPELRGRVEVVVENPDGQSVRAFVEM